MANYSYSDETLPPSEYPAASTASVQQQPKGASNAQVNSAFQKYLGRPFDNQNNIWANDPNWEQNIANSQEAKNYAAAQQPGAAAGGNPVDIGAKASAPFNNAGGASWLSFIQQFSGVTNPQGGFNTAANANQYRGNLQPVVDAFNAAHPGAKATVAGADKIDFGDGNGPTDVITSNGAWWYGNDKQWTPGQGGAGGQGGTGGGGGVPGMPGGGGAGSAANMSPEMQQLYNTLLSRSQQSLAVNPNTDPNLRPQVDAYRAEQERAANRGISQIAESAGPISNLEGVTRSAQEQAGINTGQFAGSLMSNELAARRTEIQSALTGMQGILSQDQQVQLQLQLKSIDAELQKRQLQQQNDQFLSQLGFNVTDRANYWDSLNKGLL